MTVTGAPLTRSGSEAVDATLVVHRLSSDVALARMAVVAAQAHAQIAITSALYDARMNVPALDAARVMLPKSN